MVPTGRPTVRDIAKHADVSIATVSRVTHNDPKVSEETRERVLASIAALNYQPSALGRGLAFQRHNTLGIVLPGLGGPYFAELIQGAESVAGDSGVAMLVLGTRLRHDSDRDVRNLAQRTDGLLVVGGTLSDDLAHELAQAVPVVLIADESPDLATVRADGRKAVYDLTTHLLEVHGHRRLRFLGETYGSPDITARHEGFLSALADHDLTPCAPTIQRGRDANFGALAARELHADGNLPDAVVCANDELAIGLLATLPGLGYSLPRDLAIVGFDDLDLAALTSPKLTTVHQPIFELGAQSVSLILEQGSGPRAIHQPLKPQDLVLPTETVIRESCGCAP